MNFKDALKTHFVKALINDTIGDNYQTVTRPASFSFNKQKEDPRRVQRIILLPPRGYTADSINQMNSHDEAEHATIEIKGAVRDRKNGWSKLKNTLAFIGSQDNSNVSTLDKPYMVYDLDKTPDLIKEVHSAGEAPFHVVKPDGTGFYHNLINLSDDWLILKLDKTLRPAKGVDLEQHLVNIPENHACTLREFYNNILLTGDGVYKNKPNLVNDISKIPVDQALPALCEMLYVHDSGKHEACSAFAMILKHGKKEPDIVTQYLQDTLDAQKVPSYYAHQLIEKITGTAPDEPMRYTPNT